MSFAKIIFDPDFAEEKHARIRGVKWVTSACVAGLCELFCAP